jgi:PrtD family type I secretion system ABC transporter
MNAAFTPPGCTAGHFWRHCRPHFVFGGVFSLFINLLQLALPLYTLQVFDRVLGSRSRETLVALSIAVVGVLVVHWVLDLLRARLLLAAGVAIDSLAGPPVVARALAGPAARGNADAAELKDVATLRSFLTSAGIVGLFDAPWAPVYLGVLFLLHPQFGIIAMAGTAALLALAGLNERLMREPVHATERASRSAARELDAAARQAEVIQVLGMAAAVQQRWQQRNHGVVDAHVRAARRGSLLAGLTRFTRLLVQVAMVAAGALLVIEQQATAGAMTAAMLIMARALAPAENAIVSWRGLIEARAAWRRLASLWAQLSAAPAVTLLPDPRGSVRVEQLHCLPPGAGRSLLSGVSFALDAGVSLGIIGPSGSGKSTLARLLVGWLQPAAGKVRIDGADLAHWPRAHLAPHLGYLPQDVQLLDGTVAENIARLSGAASQAVIEAARRAHVHEMIVRLPHGYDTDAGTLSGGQRRRVGLARALFGQPKLVVLDEPNSGLDSAGEQALLETMRELRCAGVTLIVVSHRPSLLMQVDKLLVLEAGRVVRFGARAEVMRRVTPRAEPAAHPVPHLVAGGVA